MIIAALIAFSFQHLLIYIPIFAVVAIGSVYLKNRYFDKEE